MSDFKIDNNRYFIFCCFVLLFLLTICPFILFKYPILVDYPNHLASFYIQGNIDNNQWLSENYLVKWEIKPYTIIEGLGGILAKYFDIFLVGKVILISGIVFICSGALLLRKYINGSIDLWVISIFLFIYNHVLFFGFVNYYVSSGLALVAMGLWVKLRNINYIVKVLLFSSISTMLFFCHLYALGIYAIFVVSYELGLIKYSYDKLSMPNIINIISQFLLPFILFVIWWNGNVKNGVVTFYNYGDLTTKIVALLSPFSFDYGQNDLLQILFTLISILVIRIIYPGGVSIYNKMKIPLLTLLVVIIIMPSSLAGNWGTDFRYPFIFMVLFVVSIKFDENNKNTVYFRRYLLGLVLVVTCYKIYYVSNIWNRINPQYQEFENALQYVSPGSKVLTVQNDTGNLSGLDARLYHHMSALSIIQRSTFWPNLFTYVTPIYPTIKTEHIDTAWGSQLTVDDLVSNKYKNGYTYAPHAKVYWENWTQDFDYLISIRFENLSTIDIKNLKLKFRGSFFDIYQIVH
ncbi:hypothetical protein [Methylobacter svalbardensis]|uniref:hypothetical protein n=1 Tax=Methylobacter svalbardensis TaxID=3080016 RepID=UPI0030ECE42A